MICKNCGSQISDQETICPVCNTPVGVDSDVMYTSNYISRQREQQRKRRICLLAGIIILICAPVGIAIGLKLGGGRPGGGADTSAPVITLPPTQQPTIPPEETPTLVPIATPYATPYIMTPKPGDISTATATPGGALPTGKAGYITGDGVRFRSGPSTSGTTIYSTLRKNTKVTVVSTADGWTKIVYNSKVGYVSANYVTTGSLDDSTPKPSKTPVPESTYHITPGDCIGRVVSKGLNVRGGPGMSYEPIMTITQGTEFAILEDVRGWYRIIVKDKQGKQREGYVGASSDLVEIVSGTVPD
ncbi:MAG: SH3 domain-containing protein [Christensenellales bacterium]|jgi:uncharacterized protein YgiM (DUF1202 family)